MVSTAQEVNFISIWFEGFLYGLYSGIFALYLRCRSDKSRTTTTGILFYALCLLYVLSTATIVCDLVFFILSSRAVTPSSFDLAENNLFHLYIVENIVIGCCDFISQCTLIYRCWIVWNQNIRVVIIPSFFAITYLATWIVSSSVSPFEYIQWESPVTETSLFLSMAVNALVTGLIVYKILRVFLEVRATTVTSVNSEGNFSSTGGTKLRQIIFVIIESAMALFAVQLVRVVLGFFPSNAVFRATDFLVVIQQMLNGITPTIILVRVSMNLSFDDKETFMEAVGSPCFNHDPPSDISSSLTQTQ